jgi:ribose transport system substrate-binding protein
MQGIRDTISGKKSKEPPGDRMTDANGWKEVEGCPLYTNDDFPLSVKQMGEILAKYPDLTAFVPTGGFPQFVPNAYKQVVEKNMERVKSKKTILVVADTLPMQMDLLSAGYSHGQVGQRPFDMGYRSMFILKDLVDKKKVDDPIYTGLDVCEPETAKTCLAK